MQLMQVNRQWASRPDDERFTSLKQLHRRAAAAKAGAETIELPLNKMRFVPHEETDLRLDIGDSTLGLTYHSFGQMAGVAGAPADYMRALPAPLAASCLSHGLSLVDVDKEAMLLMSRGELRAKTSTKYGRIWDADVTKALMDRFGDGVTGDFRIPGEFGKDVPITKANTTIYGSDHDMFVFLADEKNRIEMPNRRNGRSGSLARGFFCWNSEVGDRSCGVAFFLFDYACSNRIVWGATDYEELRIRHTETAPDKWLDAATPRLLEYSQAAAAPIVQRITAAQAALVPGTDGLSAADRAARTVTWLRRDLGLMKHEAEGAMAAHEAEEERPIETLWDASTGLTAHAKSIPHADKRLRLETIAGKVLDMVA